MLKFKAYAKSIGTRNSYILLGVGNKMPHGHTEKIPPLPVEGHKVTWNEDANEWQHVEIQEETGVIE